MRAPKLGVRQKRKEAVEVPLGQSVPGVPAILGVGRHQLPVAQPYRFFCAVEQAVDLALHPFAEHGGYPFSVRAFGADALEERSSLAQAVDLTLHVLEGRELLAGVV